MHNHKLGLDVLGSPSYKPKQGLLNRHRDSQIPNQHFPSYSFLAPSSFAFPQVPTTLYRYKQPKTQRTPSFGTLFGQESHHKSRPSLGNLYPNYDSSLDNLASNQDYQDEMSNRKEEIDLEHREKAAKEPSYFDDEFEDEFNRDESDRKSSDRDLDKDFKTNFDKNFDKEFNPKRSGPKKKNPPRNGNNKHKSKGRKTNRRPSIKKMIDTSQVEREGEDDERTRKDADTKEQKLVRITRQITVYNKKNLFEDSFDLRSIGSEENPLGDKDQLLENGQDLLDDSAANLLGGQDLLENADLSEPSDEKRNMPRLKKKRTKKGGKTKRKVSQAGNRKKKIRKRAQGKSFSPTNKRRGPGKRRGTKSKE